MALKPLVWGHGGLGPPPLHAGTKKDVLQTTVAARAPAASPRVRRSELTGDQRRRGCPLRSRRSAAAAERRRRSDGVGLDRLDPRPRCHDSHQVQGVAGRQPDDFAPAFFPSRRAERVDGLGRRELLPDEAADQAASAQLAAHLHASVDADQIAPDRRVGLARQEIAEHDAISLMYWRASASCLVSSACGRSVAVPPCSAARPPSDRRRPARRCGGSSGSASARGRRPGSASPR